MSAITGKLGTVYTDTTGWVTAVFEADDESVTKSSHGLSDDAPIKVRNSGGALPSGLSAATTYYVETIDLNSFQLFTSPGAVGQATWTTDGTGTNQYQAQTELAVTEFNLTQSGGSIDVTDSSSTGDWREKVAGKRQQWTGTLTAFAKEGVDSPSLNSSLTLFLYGVTTGGSEVYWQGDAIVTELGDSIPVEGEEAVQISLSFEGTGTLTKTDNT